MSLQHTTRILPGEPWNRIRRPLYPWVPTVERIVNTLSIPALNGPVIYVASDYGGAHDASLYETISFVYLDMEASSEWETLRRAVRKQYLGDGRRMSFKALNDRQRQKALVPFLDAANHISGIALTMAIRKTVKNFCSDKDFFLYSKRKLGLDHRIKYSEFEKMLRVVQVVSMLVGGLSKPNQNLYWISDEDALFANDLRSRAVKAVLDRWSSHYVNHPMGEVGVGTTTIDEGDRLDEDLNAIPDLMSGAVAEMVTAVANELGGRIPTQVAVPLRFSVSPKADIIYDWVCDNQYRLQRVVIVVEKHKTNGFSVSRFNST